MIYKLMFVAVSTILRANVIERKRKPANTVYYWYV